MRWMRRKEVLAIEALCEFIPYQSRETDGLPYRFEEILCKPVGTGVPDGPRSLRII